MNELSSLRLLDKGDKEAIVLSDGGETNKHISLVISDKENALSESLASLSIRPPARRLKKKLLVLDLNGLLVDIVSSSPKNFKPDIRIRGRAIFTRPFCLDFLNFCFERFEVGIWSSRIKKNMDDVINYVMGDMKHKLMFCWELRRIWEKHDPELPWEKRFYNESDTLLLDDSPYKALLNPAHTAIFPYSYHCQDSKDNALGQNGSHSIEPKSTSQKTTEKKHKAIKEKQRVSTESSRTSFSSSSCSSSLSSLECNRASHLEPCSFNQTIGPETRVRDLPSPIYQPNASFQSSQQSLDLRDVVKDSIYREARGLSVKTVSKGESRGQTLKYFDSPRPLQQPKSVNPKVSGLKGSFQVLHKLQEEPRKSSEEKLVSSTSRLKDARRFSYDGRESRDTYKSAIKLRELPRLSLDSRTGSMRGSTTEMKSSDPIGDLERGNRNFSNF
ncbi:hypothetical protein GH714_012677 [Hevea brasiliensis]|uniref:FCP1 homology domain-containing protein n=1 Tax=Hevea brasiliensis TaxID=3981 RepID=A0A6A6MMW3_HEVBR|nr:hypothetical protein GH714_012677 [Hevea brasiliensis]